MIKIASVLFLPNGFETKAHARTEHDTLAGRMARAGANLPEGYASCAPGQRCGLAVCAMCMRLFRKRWDEAAYDLGFHRERQWTRVSIITRGLLVKPGRLRKFRLDLHQARIKRALQRLIRRHFPGAVVLGGIDVSLNTVDNKVIGYQFHLYLLIDHPNTKALKDAFKKAFKPEPTASKPYSFKRVAPDQFFKALSYSYKATAYRRSTYDDERQRKDGTPRKNGKPQSLSASQSLEYASWLSDAPVDHRLLMVGVRRESLGRFDKFRFRVTSNTPVSVEPLPSPLSSDFRQSRPSASTGPI